MHLNSLKSGLRDRLAVWLGYDCHRGLLKRKEIESKRLLARRPGRVLLSSTVELDGVCGKVTTTQRTFSSNPRYICTKCMWLRESLTSCYIARQGLIREKVKVFCTHTFARRFYVDSTPQMKRCRLNLDTCSDSCRLCMFIICITWLASSFEDLISSRKTTL